MRPIDPYIEAISKASNLEEKYAETIVFWAIMTWTDAPTIRPILDINGESGTGKSHLMKMIFPWCQNPHWVDGLDITTASLRDELDGKWAVFVEEADKAKEPRNAEKWYQERYQPTFGEKRFRRQMYDGNGRNYNEEAVGHFFGPMIMHTQNVFTSMEIERRILRIPIFKNSDRDYQLTTGLKSAPLHAIAEQVQWDAKLSIASANSAWDTYMDYVRIADYLGDQEYLDWVSEKIEEKKEEDDMTKLFEPKGVVLSEATPLYVAGLRNDRRRIPVTEITENVCRRLKMDERQVCKVLRQLKFKIEKPGNKAHVTIEGEEKLRYIAKLNGIDPEELLKCDEPEEHRRSGTIWNPSLFRPSTN